MTDPTAPVANPTARATVPTALVATVWVLAALLMLSAGRGEPVTICPDGRAGTIEQCDATSS